ncbi:hypothetical protein XA68_18568 [Ophiocordyceps unilateralis]|uniref:Uncharacterized protein n=1 Tax=Ophiocordyceps unilateralis TaxID=268505 RepID=A0A2A9P0I9_OPHUN|nr:hypothetical protein XA68_18568 [Ophiocordyceps unilateralis]
MSHWKKDVSVSSVLCWAMKHDTSSLPVKNWPMLLPVMLHLIDDTNNSVRTKGLQTLQAFLSKCPSRILFSTGMGRVFEDAVFPSLFLLPSSNNENGTVSLLYEAYRALLQIANAEQCLNQKRRLLDRIIRDGILTGYRHASGAPIAVEIMLGNFFALSRP